MSHFRRASGLICWLAFSLTVPTDLVLGQTPAPSVPAATGAHSPIPLLDIRETHTFPERAAIDDSAAGQLERLCSLQEFQSLPAGDRYVYTFSPWPDAPTSPDEKNHSFRFLVGPGGTRSQTVTFSASGGGTSDRYKFKRVTDKDGRNSVQGIGNLDWGSLAEHTFQFAKPVKAFGVVLKSSADAEVRRFYWAGAKDKNGYPVSYTLSDGSMVQLGAREARGALLPGGKECFLGVLDTTGKGIVSVRYTLRGLGGNQAQSLQLRGWAFATLPAPETANLINLRSASDFEDPESITGRPEGAVDGLINLADFRFIVGTHRYVYDCATWPLQASAAPLLPVSAKATSTKASAALKTAAKAQSSTPAPTARPLRLAFDLHGKGDTGQQITLSARANGLDMQPERAVLRGDDGLPRPAIGGLGQLQAGTQLEQTLQLAKPVWSIGLAYRCETGAELQGSPAPISYTLTDGTVVNLGEAGKSGGLLKAGQKTFMGVKDNTGKGITSLTLRWASNATQATPLYVEDVAFALAGPPPGNWKLVMADEFDGDTLNPKYWTTGYTFPDIINNELQAYVPENVTVANGVCTIKVEQREAVNTDRTGRKGASRMIASGAFTSYDKFTQTYGYVEARIKMPAHRGAGVWPAFWMLPDRGREFGKVRAWYMTKDYGRGMEIDIFEFMPRWKQNDGTFPVHVGCIWSYGPVTEKDPAPHGYGGYSLANDGWGPKELNVPNLDTEFHTYGLYWSPERLIYYVDSKPIFRVKDPKKMPDVPHYFLFNIATSLNGWGKSPDKSHPKMEEILQDLPNAMEIDYFRAYSGVLEESVPPAPTDIPGTPPKYAPPPPEGATPPAPAPTTPAPAAPAPAVPAAPINSTIETPATG